jgi:glutamate dehydrogenase (NADP+)
MDAETATVIDRIRARNPGQPAFHQAVAEVVTSLEPVLERHREYRSARVVERLAEPDRIIIFRVEWLDDSGRLQLNRGYRVQMSSAIGPYKGGLRFHPSVDLDILKFLAFEQVLKCALTTLPMGGAKGGSDFDPKGKSDTEVRRFCRSFMTELHRHIGQFTDVPAGDIGVGIREIGYLFGQYKRITNEFSGVLTGKGVEWGGSYVRPEATGYGLVYFAEQILTTRGESFDHKRCLISGAGNVAQFTAAKLIEVGAKVLTMSDSNGFIHDPAGIDAEKLAWILELKNVRRGRLAEYTNQFPTATYVPAGPSSPTVWQIPADCAFPCATQNELDGKDAAWLLDNGVALVAEGANMPSTPEAVARFLDAGILYGPSKAANAGGVAVSGLEMSQNADHLSWSPQEVDERLRTVMRTIHAQVQEAAAAYGHPGNYVVGANIAAFVKVADAILAEGIA